MESTKTIHVNLDANLQIFLKEIYYLSSIGIKLPERIYQKVQHVDILTIRSFATRLLTATSQYNLINKELKEVEKPLIQEQMVKAENVSLNVDFLSLFIVTPAKKFIYIKKKILISNILRYMSDIFVNVLIQH